MPTDTAGLPDCPRTEGGERYDPLLEHIYKLGTEILAEQARRKDAESFLHALLENLPCPVWVKDSEWRYTLVNGCARDKFGWRDDAPWIGKRDSDLFPAENIAQVKPSNVSVLLTGIPCRIIIHSPSPIGEGVRDWDICKFRFSDTAGQMYVAAVAFPLDAEGRAYPFPSGEPIVLKPGDDTRA